MFPFYTFWSCLLKPEVVSSLFTNLMKKSCWNISANASQCLWLNISLSKI